MELLQMSGSLWLIWSAYWFFESFRVQKTKTSESLGSRLSHVIPLFLAFVLLFSKSIPSEQLNQSWRSELPVLAYLGIAFTTMGLSFCVWARVNLGRFWSGIVTLKEGHQLIKSGPYRYVRHPIYTGFLFAFLGSIITQGRVTGLIGFTLVLGSFLKKIQTEETLMLKAFGSQYEDFRKTTKALVPFLY